QCGLRRHRCPACPARNDPRTCRRIRRTAPQPSPGRPGRGRPADPARRHPGDGGRRRFHLQCAVQGHAAQWRDRSAGGDDTHRWCRGERAPVRHPALARQRKRLMPLLDSLKPVAAQWTARYRRSPIPAFLSWWKAELVGCLPVRWQSWFQDRRETWLAFLDGTELRLQREGQAEPFARFDLSQQAEIVRSEVQRLLAGVPEPDRRLLLVLPSDSVLRVPLQFPAAVEQNLRQVLAFEMDRQTPFKADQVHFDWQAEPLSGGKQIRVDMAVTPREILDALVEHSRTLGLALDG